MLNSKKEYLAVELNCLVNSVRFASVVSMTNTYRSWHPNDESLSSLRITTISYAKEFVHVNNFNPHILDNKLLSGAQSGFHPKP